MSNKRKPIHHMQWRCDYCIIALFGTYEEAETHELTCPARLAAIPPIPAALRVNVVPDDADESASSQGQQQQQQTTTITADLSKRQKCAFKTNPLAIWACDYCQLFQSPDYDEVLEHEKTCGKHELTSDNEKEDDSNREEEDDPSEGMNDVEKDSTNEEKSTSEGKNDKSNESSNEREGSPPSNDNAPNEKSSFPKLEAAKCNPSTKVKMSSTRRHASEPTQPGDAKPKEYTHSQSPPSNAFIRQETRTLEPWSAQEHNLCRALIVSHGPNWNLIASSIKTRTIKQVRDYALCHFSHLLLSNEPLKPSLKRTKWRCDVCRVAMFEDYEEALEHESRCYVGEVGAENGSGSGESAKKKKIRQNKECEHEKTLLDYTTNGSNVMDPKKDTCMVSDVAKNAIQETLAPKQGTVENFSLGKLSSATSVSVPTSVENNSLTVSAASMEVTLCCSVRDVPNSKLESLKSPADLEPSEKSSMKDSSNVLVKDRNLLAADSVTVEKIDVSSHPENVDNYPKHEQDELKDLVHPAEEKFTSALRALLNAGILFASLVLLVKYLSRDLFDNIIDSPSVPCMLVSLSVLIMSTYSSFAFGLVITDGRSLHRSQGVFMNVFSAICGATPSANVDPVDLGGPEDAPLPTLREYLNHPDGFHLAFAPAFFGFFAYFGALTALEEETNGMIVPSVPRKNGDNDSPVTKCGLKSVAGASAGAMAAVMLAAGIQPRKAAEFACTFNWGMVADPPGFGGFVKGDKFEEFMRSFIKKTAVTRNGCTIANDEGSVMLEDALVPVTVSAFDLLHMRGVLMSRGCMAKAARSSAGFPGLFQPVWWRKDTDPKDRVKLIPDMLLTDGGIQDSLGLNGLSAFPSNSAQGIRVINMAVGDFGFNGPRGMKDLPRDVDAESLVSIAIVNTPLCGPWAMRNGQRAVEAARRAMLAALDIPLEKGASSNHYTLRVDASRYLE